MCSSRFLEKKHTIEGLRSSKSISTWCRAELNGEQLAPTLYGPRTPLLGLITDTYVNYYYAEFER